MNKISLFFAIIVGLSMFGCKPKTPLEELIERKDSLKNVYEDVGREISELEDQIVALDSTIEKRRVLVTSKKLTLSTFSHYLDIHGNIESNKVANVNPEVPGEIVSLTVKTGQQVSKGQVLARLNADVMFSSIAEVKNGLELATIVFDKQKRLWDQKIGSEIEYLQAKNSKESLELKLKNLQTQTGKSTINAPFSGVVDEVFQKVGEGANPMLPILRLVNLSQMYVKADVSEDFISTISKGNTVIVEFPSINLKKKVKVNRVGNFINPNNRTFNVEIDLPNTDQKLKPNLLASLKILDYSSDSAIVVASSLIQQDSDQRDFVYTIRKEGDELVAEKTLVKIGISYKGETEILGGLSEGQEIIDQGARNVADSEVIEVMKMEN